MASALPGIEMVLMFDCLSFILPPLRLIWLGSYWEDSASPLLPRYALIVNGQGAVYKDLCRQEGADVGRSVERGITDMTWK